jgi:hypothetical protein
MWVSSWVVGLGRQISVVGMFVQMFLLAVMIRNRHQKCAKRWRLRLWRGCRASSCVAVGYSYPSVQAEYPISAWLPANHRQEPPFHNALVEVELQ